MAKKTQASQAAPSKPRSPNHTARGTFAPSNSLGGAKPGAGRKPKAVREAEAELWKAHPDAADRFIRTMYELAAPGNKPTVRFHAAREGLRRMFGRERMTIEIQSNDQFIMDLVGEEGPRAAADIASIGAEAQRHQRKDRP